MGYDDDECLECYCEGGSNEITSKHKMLCMRCINEIIGETTNERIKRAILNWKKESERVILECDECGSSMKNLLKVPACGSHGGSKNKDGSSSDSD